MERKTLEPLHAITLGLLQGLTEFLPVSSSAHLILLPKVMDWPDQGLTYDLAAHFGSLLAVMIYFRTDLYSMMRGWVRAFAGEQNTEAKLMWLLLLATLPIGFAGLLFHRLVEGLREPLIIAGATVLFGLLLWGADRYGKTRRNLDDLQFREAIFIGLLQILAMLPGTSRAGITITAGLLLGLRRQAASRFSFLLAIPTILLASANELITVTLSELSVDWFALGLVTLAAFISAYAAIHYFLKWVEYTGMLPYVIYRLGLGGILFVVFW